MKPKQNQHTPPDQMADGLHMPEGINRCLLTEHIKTLQDLGVPDREISFILGDVAWDAYGLRKK